MDLEMLCSILSYNEESGDFFWKHRPIRKGHEREDKIWNTRYAGTKAGCRNVHGYTTITCKRCRPQYYLAHHLVWLLKTGTYPEADIDHANGIRHDNRFSNLRLATRAQNNANATVPRHNRSGHKGVSWSTEKKRWKAEIKFDGVKHHIGYFEELEAAALAREKAAQKLHGEFYRINAPDQGG